VVLLSLDHVFCLLARYSTIFVLALLVLGDGGGAGASFHFFVVLVLVMFAICGIGGTEFLATKKFQCLY
jgi:hypothetical protein